MARSNRQLTQFAVDKVRQYLVGGPEGFKDETAGNTTVELDKCPCCPRTALRVLLYDKVILSLIVSPLNPRLIAGIMVASGDFYDSKGRPSRTTRERLNGLLDALGASNFIPEGVRVFIRDDNGCYVGKGDACRSFDAGQPAVIMLSHPSDVVFCS